MSCATIRHRGVPSDVFFRNTRASIVIEKSRNFRRKTLKSSLNENELHSQQGGVNAKGQIEINQPAAQQHVQTPTNSQVHQEVGNTDFRAVRNTRTTLRYNWAADHDSKVLNVNLGYTKGILTSGKDNVMVISKSVAANILRKGEPVPEPPPEQEVAASENVTIKGQPVQSDQKIADDFLYEKTNQFFKKIIARDGVDVSATTGKQNDGIHATQLEDDAITMEDLYPEMNGALNSTNAKPSGKSTDSKKNTEAKKNAYLVSGVKISRNAKEHYVWRKREWYKAGLQERKMLIGDAYTHFIAEARFKIDSIPANKLDDFLQEFVVLSTDETSHQVDDKLVIPKEILDHLIQRLNNSNSLSEDSKIILIYLQQQSQKSCEEIHFKAVQSVEHSERKLQTVKAQLVEWKEGVADKLLANDGGVAWKNKLIIGVNTSKSELITTNKDSQLATLPSTNPLAKSDKDLQKANELIDSAQVREHELQTQIENAKTQLSLAKTQEKVTSKLCETEKAKSMHVIINLVHECGKRIRLHDPAYLESLNVIVHDSGVSRSVLDDLVENRLREAFLNALMDTKKEQENGFGGTGSSRISGRQSHSKVDKAVKETEEVRIKQEIKDAKRKDKKAADAPSQARTVVLRDEDVLKWTRFFLSMQVHDESFWHVVCDFCATRSKAVRDEFLQNFTKRMPVWFNFDDVIRGIQEADLKDLREEKSRRKNEVEMQPRNAGFLAQGSKHDTDGNALVSEHRNEALVSQQSSEALLCLPAPLISKPLEEFVDAQTVRLNIVHPPSVSSSGCSKNGSKSRSSAAGNAQAMPSFKHTARPTIASNDARRLLQVLGRTVVFPGKALPETEAEAKRDMRNVHKREYQERLNTVMKRDALIPSGKYVVEWNNDVTTIGDGRFGSASSTQFPSTIEKMNSGREADVESVFGDSIVESTDENSRNVMPSTSSSSSSSIAPHVEPIPAHYVSKRKALFLRRVDTLEFRVKILWTLEPETWRKHLCMLGPGKLAALLAETSHDAAGFTPLISGQKAQSWKHIKSLHDSRIALQRGVLGRGRKLMGRKVKGSHSSVAASLKSRTNTAAPQNTMGSPSPRSNVLTALAVADISNDGPMFESGTNNSAVLSKRLCHLSLADTIKDPVERHAEEVKAKNMHHKLEHAQAFVGCILEALNRAAEKLSPEQACVCMSALARLSVKGLIHVPDMSMSNPTDADGGGATPASSSSYTSSSSARMDGLNSSCTSTNTADASIDRYASRYSSAKTTSGMKKTPYKSSDSLSKIDRRGFMEGDSEVTSASYVQNQIQFESEDLERLVRNLQGKLITEKSLMQLSPKNAVQLLESIPILYPSDRRLHQNAADFCAWMLPVASDNFRKPVPLKELRKIALVYPHLGISNKHKLFQGLVKATELSIKLTKRKAKMLEPSMKLTSRNRARAKRELLGVSKITTAAAADLSIAPTTTVAAASRITPVSEIPSDLLPTSSGNPNPKKLVSVRKKSVQNCRKVLIGECELLNKLSGDLQVALKDRRTRLAVKRRLQSEMEGLSGVMQFPSQVLL